MKTNNIFKYSAMVLFGAISFSCNDDPASLAPQPIEYKNSLVFEKKSSVYKEKQADAAWIETELRVVDPYCVPEVPPTNAWGGRTDRVATDIEGAAGFFRLGKVGKRWVFVDPDNGVDIIHGTQNVAPSTSSFFTSKYPDQTVWAADATALLKKYHFNFTDYGGVRPAKIPEDLEDALLRPDSDTKNPYSIALYMLRSFMWDKGSQVAWGFDDNNNNHNRLNLIFEPAYEEYLDSEVKRICDLFRDDVHVIGYQLDNELGFRGWDDRYGDQGILLNKFLALPTTSPAQQYAEAFVAEFNLNRKDVLSVTKASHIDSKGLRAAFDEFRLRVARKYYQMYHDAIRKYDTNHLIFGSRLHSLGMYDKETLQACGEFCDVVTINYYGTMTPDPEYMNNVREWTNDRPFFITEFYVKGTDANYGGVQYNNLSGGGWVVPSQIERSYYYQNFCIGLLEAQNCVGWTHFAYDDVYTSSAANNCNRGLVSATYEPYVGFLEGMNLVNRNVYVIADYFDK